MSEDIKLNDLLHLTDEEISRTKIRFMTNYNGTEPIKVFRRDPDVLNTDWLLSRKENDNGKDAEHLHKGENVIGLVRLPENNDLWGSHVSSVSETYWNAQRKRAKTTTPTMSATRERN